jgi:hypothetical protein
MNVTTHTSWRLVRVIMVIVAVAAMAVPLAQATRTPTGKYGPLDPWAYNLIHRSTPSIPLITEHSAGQNGLAQSSADAKYGPLDPWSYNVIHESRPSIPLITEHSAGQNSTSQRTVVPLNSGSISVAPTRFSWHDAGVGASAVLALVLLVAGAMAVRRRNALAHVHF